MKRHNKYQQIPVVDLSMQANPGEIENRAKPAQDMEIPLSDRCMPKNRNMSKE